MRHGKLLSLWVAGLLSAYAFAQPPTGSRGTPVPGGPTVPGTGTVPPASPVGTTPIPGVPTVTTTVPPGSQGVPTIVGTVPRTGRTIPIDAGTVPLKSSGDGITLLVYGVLSRERFVLDHVEPVGSRLASRSPDPDMFRVIRYGVRGELLDTIHFWSPLDRFEWDLKGEHEHRVSTHEAKVIIPVSVHHGVSAIELQWPSGTGLGRIDVSGPLLKFCTAFPKNPGCLS
jgi:hypothetical protein